MEGLLGVHEFTEGNWLTATRTDSARANLSHEASTLAVLFA